jgi:predicted acyltransferase
MYKSLHNPRYLALDSMRGFVMLVLCSNGFGLGSLVKDPVYRPIASQFHHLPWDGLIIWELIMPAFMFMVGASLPFGLARRLEQGATFKQNLRHVGARALRLILLGQFLTTLHAGRYRYEPYETLTQLGLSYFCCFLILQLPFLRQALAAALLMLVNWGLYVLFPGSAGPFAPNDNIGVLIDKAVFGLNHAGSWATINFLGSTVTVLFGAWTGALLMSRRSHMEKLKFLLAAVTASFAVAIALTPFNPIIHKAWTAAFTFYHTGFVLAGVLVFFWLFDLRQYRRLAFPLVVVGVNSIFIYMLIQMLQGWIDKSLGVFTGRFQFIGPLAPAMQACAVTLVMWYACHWLYQRKIFFKV